MDQTYFFRSTAWQQATRSHEIRRDRPVPLSEYWSRRPVWQDCRGQVRLNAVTVIVSIADSRQSPRYQIVIGLHRARRNLRCREIRRNALAQWHLF